MPSCDAFTSPSWCHTTGRGQRAQGDLHLLPLGIARPPSLPLCLPVLRVTPPSPSFFLLLLPLLPFLLSCPSRRSLTFLGRLSLRFLFSPYSLPPLALSLASLNAEPRGVRQRPRLQSRVGGQVLRPQSAIASFRSSVDGEPPLLISTLFPAPPPTPRTSHCATAAVAVLVREQGEA